MDSIIKNTKRIARLSGGTRCSLPLAAFNAVNQKSDLIIYVSDNQSWIGDHSRGWNYGWGSANDATETMREWEKFKSRNPNAKMVCIDLQPYTDTQAPNREDILNIGGFSDSVFEIINAFAAGKLQEGFWVDVIEKINLKELDQLRN